MAAVLLTGTPRFDPRMPLTAELPDRVGKWTGQSVVFCQNPQCAAKQVGHPVKGPCTHCGAPLAALSPREKAFLPPDTQIVRKEYERSDGAGFLVTIVFSGMDRAGIHPPQWCLRGQGYVIRGERDLNIHLAEARRLRVRVLDVDSTETPGGANHAALAYWFVGGGCETPSRLLHLVRLGLRALYPGVQERAAYVSVLTPRDRQGKGHLHRLARFIELLHPAIRPPP